MHTYEKRRKDSIVIEPEKRKSNTVIRRVSRNSEIGNCSSETKAETFNGKEVEKIEKEIEKTLCEICVDRKTVEEMFWSDHCSHSYCLVCMSKHVAAKIEQNIIEVKCPEFRLQ